MILGTQPLATAPLAGAVPPVTGPLIQQGGAIELLQRVADKQAGAELQLRQIVAQPQAGGILQLQQTVKFRLIQPADAINLQQHVLQVQQGWALTLLQRVLDPGSTDPGQRTHVPPCHVLIDGTAFTGQVSIHNISIAQTEDNNATASFFVFFERGVQIFVPSFQGKSVQVLVNTDPGNLASPLAPLFTGNVDRATHIEERKGIQFECTDLRLERLGRSAEDEHGRDTITRTLGMIYSPVTQKEGAVGREFIEEALRTYIGSIGYNRAGDFYAYTWGTTGKPVNWVLDNQDIHYKNLTTQFQTRSEIKNAVTIKMEYRWHCLNYFSAIIEAKRPRILRNNYNFDLETFSADSMRDRATSFAPWETYQYSIIPANAVFPTGLNTGNVGMAEINGVQLAGRAIGFEAWVRRRVAQPVTERYALTLRAPQSIDAYGEEVKGSEHNWSIDHEYNRENWEAEGNRDGSDAKRAELATAWHAGIQIAKKELIGSHRQNYVTVLLRSRLLLADVGQIVQLNTRIVQVTGQIVGINWRIGDGVRDTQLRLAVSYLDTDMPAPAENLEPPKRPDITGVIVSGMRGTSEYSNGALQAYAPEIREKYTNELEPEIAPVTRDIALENTVLTLINGR